MTIMLHKCICNEIGRFNTADPDQKSPSRKLDDVDLYYLPKSCIDVFSKLVEIKFIFISKSNT